MCIDTNHTFTRTVIYNRTVITAAFVVCVLNRFEFTEDVSNVSSVFCFCLESLANTSDLTDHNDKAVKKEEEEEEETKAQPAAKRKRGQIKAETKCEEKPNEEKKNEGKSDLMFIFIGWNTVTV